MTPRTDSATTLAAAKAKWADVIIDEWESGSYYDGYKAAVPYIEALEASNAALERQLADAQARERAAVEAHSEILDWCTAYWNVHDAGEASNVISEIQAIARKLATQPQENSHE